VEKYRTDNYEIWLGLRETLSRIPEWRVPLNRVVIWVDPLDATQEYTGRLIKSQLTIKKFICINIIITQISGYK
jgi:hypothetical protein